MSEWVLVPVKQHETQYDAISDSGIMWREQTSASIYAMHIAARPPIPRATWDAMGERLGDSLMNGGYPIFVTKKEATAALRAALGNPVVESDAP